MSGAFAELLGVHCNVVMEQRHCGIIVADRSGVATKNCAQMRVPSHIAGVASMRCRIASLKQLGTFCPSGCCAEGRGQKRLRVIDSVSRTQCPMMHGGRPMDASETFLRFAAECELMAKVSSTAEGRSTWQGMAERWVRCAELSQQQ